ncbi:MAG: ferredoxin [Bacteriovoracaceae bacterium]|nr:ferredoxin [Bacteriovoracaceae bacterium]
MNPTTIALFGAFILVAGLVTALFLINLLLGGVTFVVLKPKITFLKSDIDQGKLAFFFKLNSDEKAIFNRINIRMFNPFGTPTRLEVASDFDGAFDSFAREVNFGVGLKKLVETQGLDKAKIELEVSSTKDGVVHQYLMQGSKFKEKLQAASVSFEDWQKQAQSKIKKAPILNIVGTQKSQIAEPSSVKPQISLKIATNPQFEKEFQGASSGEMASASTTANANNFLLTKVWIEPGCIVCNACEDIFPEVFEVKADTCIVRLGAPLDNGLRVKEAAEACPVEVIKFTKAS